MSQLTWDSASCFGGMKIKTPKKLFVSAFAGFGASDEDSRVLECWEGVKMRCFFCYLNLDPCLLLQSDAMMHVIFVKTWQFSYSFGGCACLRIWTAIWWNCWWMVANHRSYTRLKKAKLFDWIAVYLVVDLGCWETYFLDLHFNVQELTWVTCCVLTDLSSSAPQTLFFSWQL